MTGSTKTTVKPAPKTAKPKPKPKASNPQAAPRKLAPDTSDLWRTDSLLKVMIGQLADLNDNIAALIVLLAPG